MEIKVLHVCIALHDGGVERLLYNYYRNLYNMVGFDFLVYDAKEGMLEREFKEFGCKIYKVNGLSKAELNNELNQILDVGEYNVIHFHGYFNLRLLLIAKKRGIKTRILHSHSTIVQEELRKKIRLRLAMMLATDFWACGQKAGQAMWKNRRFHIMRNAIDVEEFEFNEQVRKEYRKRLNLEDELAIINIGRLCKQKNQEFLLNVVRNLIKRNIKFKLFIVGDGELRNDLLSFVNQHALNEYVKFLGARGDVSHILNAMDLFVLPSIFEGLPVSVIEAQANGLPCLISDSITDEVVISSHTKSLPLSCNVWVDEICQFCILNDRKQGKEIVSNAGYNIQVESQNLVKKYKELANNNALKWRLKNDKKN